MSPQGVMSSKEASNNPGLCPDKEQLSFRIPSRGRVPPSYPRTAPVKRETLRLQILLVLSLQVPGKGISPPGSPMWPL